MAKSPRKSSVMGRLSARMTWDRVKIRTASNEAEEDGKLVVGVDSIGFVHNSWWGNWWGNLSIPTEAVTKVSYKNHYMTISFNDGKDLVGSAEFKLDRTDYQGVLGAVEEVTGVVFDQVSIPLTG